MDTNAAALVAQQALALPARALLQVRPLRGGLQSAVARVLVTAPGPLPQQLPRTLVVKQLLGAHRREAEVYRLLWGSLPQPPAARVLAHSDTADACYLCLEDVRSISAWPWRDHAMAVAACETLARIHDVAGLADAVPPSSFEQELRASAVETLALAAAAKLPGGRLWRRLGDLRRVVAALERMRARLLESGSTLVHGDVHPGNVLVRAGGRPGRIVLIDWAASRIGSPLEDVASWLHSLGCWDADSRRRHDSLLAAYLRARQHPMRLDAAVRANYWLASASNGLAGAIRYHLSVLLDPASSGRARRASLRALDEWQRVMRRAAAVLAPTSR
jgi:aminoglycoside phosphotransferase (APT) family kinase protein